MSTKATEHAAKPVAKAEKSEKLSNVEAACAKVGELCADYEAKKDALKPLHAAFVAAEEEATAAEAKLRKAETDLVKAAHGYHPEENEKAEEKPAK